MIIVYVAQPRVSTSSTAAGRIIEADKKWQ